jgi:hypothetical protein
MKKIIKLTETELQRLIKNLIRESDPGDGQPDDFSDVVMLNKDEEEDEDPDFEQNLAERRYYRRLSEQSQQEITTKINGLKSCYTKANNVTTKGKKYTYNFPGSCQKGLNEDCIKKIMIDLSKFAGNHMKNSSFQICVNKISPEIKKRTQSWG